MFFMLPTAVYLFSAIAYRLIQMMAFPSGVFE